MTNVGDVIDYDGARWRVVHVTPGLVVTTPRGRRVDHGHLGLRRLTPFELLPEAEESSAEEALERVRKLPADVVRALLTPDEEPVRQVAMTTNVLWRQYKEFSGCLIRGTAPIVPQDPSKHLSCAAWLTSEAEAPSYGFVQSYDGAGISAGLLHNILVAPRDLSQGDLGQLVRRILDAVAQEEARTGDYVFGSGGASEVLKKSLADHGWVLAQDGKFRTADGKLVPGAALRNWVAPPDGKVPQSGANWVTAATLAGAFHDLFAWDGSWKIQEDFAIAWLARGNNKDELNVYRTFHPDLDSFIALPVSAIPPEVHVAMCVYHSFSVNSPAVAAQCLDRAFASFHRSPAEFAKALIRELGLHGRDVWHDQPGDGNDRYDRTRVALWSRSDLFPGGRDLMPRDL